MNIHQNKNNFFLTAIFSLVVGIFIILFIAALIMYKISQTQNRFLSGDDLATYVPAPVRVSPPAPKGKLSLRLGDPAITSENTTTIVVTADSAGTSITGYDLVLEYDDSALQLATVKSLDDVFQTFAKKSDRSPLIVTGIKKIGGLEEAGSTIFSNTDLVAITFRIKQRLTEDLIFNLEFTPGSLRDSNLIDENSEDVLGRVIGVKNTVFGILE